MNKVQKIRAEIKRLYNQSLVDENRQAELGLKSAACTSYGKSKVCKELLSFIDSMQEECNITGIKSKEATGKLKEYIDNVSEEGLEKAYKQLEELTKECMYSKDNYTDEDRKVLCDGCEEECEFNKKEEPVSEIDFEQDLYKYFGQVKDFTLGMRIAKRFYEIGRNYQEPVSEDLEEVIRKYEQRLEKENPATEAYDFASAIRFGANWQKQQMMAKAIDATVHIDAGGYPYIPQMELYDYGKDIPLVKEGDKYKVILIKED